MPPIGLVVNLRHALAGRGHDAARVEHHARDWVVVGVGVVDGAGPEIPDLGIVLAFCVPWGWFPVRKGTESIQYIE